MAVIKHKQRALLVGQRQDYCLRYLPRMKRYLILVHVDFNKKSQN